MKLPSWLSNCSALAAFLAAVATLYSPERRFVAQFAETFVAFLLLTFAALAAFGAWSKVTAYLLDKVVENDLMDLETKRRHAPLWARVVPFALAVVVFFVLTTLIGIIPGVGHRIGSLPPSYSKQVRSTVARHAFVKMSECPATGKHRLPCPGYIIDHVIPLCAGGPDKPSNMQWQTVADAKAKDVEERRICRRK